MASRSFLRGFTISEVIIAILIVGVAIVPIFLIFSRGTSGTLQTKDEILAWNLAEELIDFALIQNYDNPFLKPTTAPSLVASHQMVLNTSRDSVTLSGDPKFERFFNVRETIIPAGWTKKYKLLMAEIRWKNSTGVMRKVQLSALKCK
ncbi:type II secretion system protein [bacterium]|nr:type II secretion system protein [bacterium]